ncbi:orotidine 5'-phosphate decarboxylase [Bifidobacterium margollesii]|uniref:Orotidine-5'-phosphate decarboxylase n=1 Tax=Bifidobacterium margollesii TaxID=2020964 RepID=A0A2N5J9E0_9BIFI|nr:orotidine-5'-phosphate decarboxylase [Bifidobacterium margollesii]PLS30834.1 orotidine 5'-phosphate decarboxylase [Bifidobacterium margollesii]
MITSTEVQNNNIQRSEFGKRLKASMDQYGPLCVGIDPHRKILANWGYNVDAKGAELFAMRMLQAAQGRAAAVKFQMPMFERYGSKGFAALERALYAARQMGVITIVDCLRGGLPTTVSALADAYLKSDSPMLADAITLLPYYGFRSLTNLVGEALENGRGVFIASVTSNTEGISLQSAIRQRGDFPGQTVAYGIAHAAQNFNEGVDGMGSVGLIIGATIGQWMKTSGVDPSVFTGPILSPGYGWQGAESKDLQTVFKGTKGNVLVTVSRSISTKGPEIADLATATEQIALDVREALTNAMDEDDRENAAHHVPDSSGSDPALSAANLADGRPHMSI